MFFLFVNFYLFALFYSVKTDINILLFFLWFLQIGVYGLFVHNIKITIFIRNTFVRFSAGKCVNSIT